VTGRRVDIDLELPADPSAAGLARVELRRALAGTLEHGLLEDLRLVVTELVTNAVVHGRGAVRLRVQHDAGAVRGEVVDEGGGFEHELRVAGPLETTGRGLLLVERLTTRWGVHEGTTHVWFELGGAPGAAEAGPEVGAERRPPRLPQGDP
jgi:anti-sigma regulatory factor (Ser/Thr protein kinase)